MATVHLENLIVVVIAGSPKPLKIAESFRPNRWVRPRQEIVQLIVQLNPECAAVIVPLYGSNPLESMSGWQSIRLLTGGL